MSIEKTLIHAQRIVDVLPQCRRDDMQNLIKLLDEQQKQITAQSETILQQREQIALLRQRLAPQSTSHSVPVWQAAAVDMMI